jgi:hypothetical protein
MYSITYRFAFLLNDWNKGHGKPRFTMQLKCCLPEGQELPASVEGLGIPICSASSVKLGRYTSPEPAV